MKSEHRTFSPNSGSSPTLLALHGFTGSPMDFEILFPFTPDQLTWRFVALPGHLPGGDEPCTESIPCGWDRFDHGLRTVFEEAESRRDRLIVLAYSMGARVFLEWMRQSGLQPDALMMISVHPGLFDTEELEARKQQDLTLAAKLPLMEMEVFASFWIEQPLIRSQHRADDPNALARLARKHRLDPHSLANSLIHLGQGTLPSQWESIRELRCPVWLITGEHDTKYRGLARQIEPMLLDNGRWIDIPDASHAPHLENPSVFADALNRFIEESSC